jgi:hypothetical protein
MERRFLEQLKERGVPDDIKGIYYGIHKSNPIVSAGTSKIQHMSLHDLVKACCYTITEKDIPFKRWFLSDRSEITLTVGGTYLFLDCMLFALLYKTAHSTKAEHMVSFYFPCRCTPLGEIKKKPEPSRNLMICLQRPPRTGQHSNNWLARHADGDYVWLGKGGVWKMSLPSAVKHWGTETRICM